MPRAVLSNTAAAGHTWLFKFKLIEVKSNLECCFKCQKAFQVLNNPVWPVALDWRAKIQNSFIITESPVGPHWSRLQSICQAWNYEDCIRIRFTYIKLNAVNNSGLKKVQICFPPMEIKSGDRQSRHMRLLQGGKNLNSFLLCCCPAVTQFLPCGSRWLLKLQLSSMHSSQRKQGKGEEISLFLKVISHLTVIEHFDLYFIGQDLRFIFHNANINYK